MTISILISNYQKSQYVTQLKKVYTEINQAFSQMTTDIDCPNDLEASGIAGTGTSWAVFGDALAKYMKVSKNCRTTANLGCWATQIKGNYDGSGGTSNYDSDTRYAFMTITGASIYADNWGGCSNWSNGLRVCGNLLVDINGPTKGPNYFGRDVFSFYIVTSPAASIYPEGGAKDEVPWIGPWRNQTTGNMLRCYPGRKDGGACTGRVIEEGWQMNY